MLINFETSKINLKRNFTEIVKFPFLLVSKIIGVCFLFAKLYIKHFIKNLFIYYFN